jgi:AcrR family transcriptional regulator
MRRTGENLARTSQDTRERILEAAEAALETQSARIFQLRDIAAQVGVSASLIVQYFGGKEELVYEASLRRLARNSTDHVTALDALPKAQWTIRNFIAATVERDYRYSHVGRDLFSQSWWWSADHERRLQEVLAPRLLATRMMIGHVLGVGPDIDLTEELRVLSDVYYSGLRESWTCGHSPSECADRLIKRIDWLTQLWRDARRK